MRTLVFVVVALGLGVASLKVVPAQADPAVQQAIADCSRGFSSGVRKSAGPKAAKHLSADDVEAAARPLCEIFVERPTLMKKKSATAYAAAVAKAPRAGLPLCNVLVESDLAANKKLYRFASEAERNSYRQAHCALAIRYIDGDTGAISRKRLSAENPSLYVPLCASLVQDGASSEPTDLSTEQIKTFARRSCTRALENGVFTPGHFGLVDAKLNEKRFSAIVTAEATSVAQA